MITVYGIKNCDTVKKSLRWLGDHAMEYQFHDFRKDGLERDLLEQWVNELGIDTILNRKGTTWRKLPDDQKNDLSEKAQIDLLLEYPAMIKRPVFDLGATIRVGFSKNDQVEIEKILDLSE